MAGSPRNLVVECAFNLDSLVQAWLSRRQFLEAKNLVPCSLDAPCAASPMTRICLVVACGRLSSLQSCSVQEAAGPSFARCISNGMLIAMGSESKKLPEAARRKIALVLRVVVT